MVEHHGDRLRRRWLINPAVGCSASSHRRSLTEKAPLRAGPFFVCRGEATSRVSVIVFRTSPTRTDLVPPSGKPIRSYQGRAVYA